MFQSSKNKSLQTFYNSFRSLILGTRYNFPGNRTRTAGNGSLAGSVSLHIIRIACHWFRAIRCKSWCNTGLTYFFKSNYSFSKFKFWNWIKAAINLEIPTEKISHIDVRMEGLNGQLPNLDLVNLVHRLHQQERFVTTLKERVGHFKDLIACKILNWIMICTIFW